MRDVREGQTVVITGASAGVGRATAAAFARRGASVGLIARGRAGLEGARREVEALGGRAIVVAADVADASQIERAAGDVEEQFGPIDVWVNNAMTSVFSPIKEMSADEFKRVTEVTYLGVVYGTLAALKRMLPRNSGSIIEVGSALAYRGIPLQAAYCGAKHAIQGFCDSLRTELMHDKSAVRITMVQLPARTHRSSIGSRAVSAIARSRCRPSISRKLRRMRSSGPASTTGARFLWVRQRKWPSSATSWRPASATGISPETASNRNKPLTRRIPIVPTICGSRSTTSTILARTAASVRARSAEAGKHG